METPHRSYSCETAAQTLEWMTAIAHFLRPFKPLMDAHVVNFFKDRLWEMVDKEWMDCLKEESVESLLGIPSGLVQEGWPHSLQEFVLTLRSLSFPREPKFSHTILSNMHVMSLGSVLSQGMNLKKKHEVEILAAVVNSITRGVNAETIIDVGAGQGYLAQALTFEYQLSVVAIDASLHHSTVTSARAERIKRHYAAKMRKSQYGSLHLKVPRTVTCRLLSSDILAALSNSLDKGNAEQMHSLGSSKCDMRQPSSSCNDCSIGFPLVLAGLHACGDLSVNMLRTFVECEQVRALIGIPCCYNLLSEDCFNNTNIPCGFPVSRATKLLGFSLGKNSRDLACQSAERWKSLTKDAALQNFELHAFRATFQMVLDKYYPKVLITSPSIGRQGKALRRQQTRRVIESQLGADGTDIKAGCNMKVNSWNENPVEVESMGGLYNDVASPAPKAEDTSTATEATSQTRIYFDLGCKEAQSLKISDKYILFKDFSKSALGRLGLEISQDIDFLETWKEAQPFFELIGAFWSIRAALGPLVETYILLDRLLFLQEQTNVVEALLFPLFDPTLSPRNMAMVAWKN